jgi:hypothetical protein
VGIVDAGQGCCMLEKGLERALSLLGMLSFFLCSLLRDSCYLLNCRCQLDALSLGGGRNYFTLYRKRYTGFYCFFAFLCHCIIIISTGLKKNNKFYEKKSKNLSRCLSHTITRVKRIEGMGDFRSQNRVESGYRTA